MALVDAQARSRTSRTFQTPTQSELRGVRKGDWVKVAEDGIRFWVQIQHQKGPGWVALTSDDQKFYVLPKNVMGIKPAFSNTDGEEPDEEPSQFNAGTLAALVLGGGLALYLLTRS